jgi:hypothetical protein
LLPNELLVRVQMYRRNYVITDASGASSTGSSSSAASSTPFSLLSGFQSLWQSRTFGALFDEPDAAANGDDEDLRVLLEVPSFS